jgi:squalene-hopene/tetraprenyl-beta-curcumene cyclase
LAGRLSPLSPTMHAWRLDNGTVPSLSIPGTSAGAKQFEYLEHHMKGKIMHAKSNVIVLSGLVAGVLTTTLALGMHWAAIGAETKSSAEPKATAAAKTGIESKVTAETKPSATSKPQQLDAIVSRALNFLAKQGQAEDGSYSKQSGVGVTLLVTAAVLRSGRTIDDPLVAKSLKFIEGYVQPDGGVYTPDQSYKNYETCLAIMCLTEANVGGRYTKILQGAEKYVKDTQWQETNSIDKTDMKYGGAGYGKSNRPDLSNTSFLVDALKACGRGEDDEAMKKALIFVSRCQNFESENNTAPFAVKNPDGGFFYTAAAGGSSAAGNTPEGGLRSYASMTYAGLKSMLYAGVKQDDPRVKAAYAWIQKNYDLKTNPGMGASGLFYYYQVFAKALAAMGKDALEDAKGVKHDWRRDLIEELGKQQKENGSWVNEADRWMESDPNLVTGYALLALSYCRPPAAATPR